MLKQRVITAVILLLVLLPAMFAPMSWPFAVLTLVMVAAAGWEWGRLNGASPGVAIAMGGVVAVLCGAALAAGWVGIGANPAWWLACAVWVLGGALAVKVGPSAWPELPRLARWVLGVALLWTAWLALASAKVVGINFLLSVFCLVWAADIAAYFGGNVAAELAAAADVEFHPLNAYHIELPAAVEHDAVDYGAVILGPDAGGNKQGECVAVIYLHGGGKIDGLVHVVAVRYFCAVHLKFIQTQSYRVARTKSMLEVLGTS